MLLGGADQIKEGQALLNLEQRVQKWMELRDSGASSGEIELAEFELAEAIKKAPFEIQAKLPFFQQMLKKFDATQAFQQFRLPGSERLVEDRREEHSRGKTSEDTKNSSRDTARKDSDESRGEKLRELRLRDGKLIRQKGEENSKGVASRLGDASRGALDQKVATDRVERMLSAFEKMVIARFEGGKQIAKGTPDGKPAFLGKSADQWRSFFNSFINRTVQKKALLSEIREFLFRGLVSRGAKGVMIGDLNFTSGRMEKFVRFSILAEMMAKLKALVPGDSLARGALANLTGEELMYLALAASRARDMGFSMLPSQGKFMGSRAEAEAAAALGVPMEQHLKQKARGLRGRRGGGLFSEDPLGEEGGGGDLPHRFVPWWNWGNLARPNKLRWVTAVFYGSLLILSIIGVAAMTLRLMSGH